MACRLLTSMVLICGLVAMRAPIAAASDLDVLPLDLTRLEVLEVMRLMTLGLGTECTLCHANERNDYVSDELPAKAIGLAMMRMVEASRPELDWAHPPRDLCFQCHEGSLTVAPEVPRSLPSSSCNTRSAMPK